LAIHEFDPKTITMDHKGDDIMVNWLDLRYCMCDFVSPDPTP
jgi:hypothetical protein